MGVGGQGHPQGLLPTAFRLSSMGKGQSDSAQLPHAVQATQSEVTKADGESFRARWSQRWCDSWHCGGGTKVGRCSGQGGSSHLMGVEAPVLNGASWWDVGFQDNHLSKCFVGFSSVSCSRVPPCLIFQSEKWSLILAVSLVMGWEFV